MYRTFIDNEAKDFLVALVDNLDSDSAKMLNQNELVFEDADFYVRKNIKDLGGTQDLISRSDSERTGTRNIDRATLPALQNLILQGIQVSYATHATEADPSKVVYSTKKPATAVPAMQNGELIIEQDDKPLLSIPMDRFFTAADNDQPKGVKDVVWLKNWRLVKADRFFNLKIKMADGQSIDNAAEHFIEVRLLGTKTRKR